MTHIEIAIGGLGVALFGAAVTALLLWPKLDEISEKLDTLLRFLLKD